MGGNAHIAEQAYDAFKNGDIPRVIGLLSDDVTWRCPMTLPQGGTFVGHAGVMEFFQGLGKAWAELTLDVEALGDVGDNLVVSVVRAAGSLSNGKVVSPGLVHVFGIRDGKISSFREYTDLDGALV